MPVWLTNRMYGGSHYHDLYLFLTASTSLFLFKFIIFSFSVFALFKNPYQVLHPDRVDIGYPECH